MEPNTCIRGCCTSESIPLHLSPSSFTLLSPIARGTVSSSPLSLSLSALIWIRFFFFSFFRIGECGIRSDSRRAKSSSEEANLVYFRWPGQVPQAFAALMVSIFCSILRNFLTWTKFHNVDFLTCVFVLVKATWIIQVCLSYWQHMRSRPITCFSLSSATQGPWLRSCTSRNGLRVLIKCSWSRFSWVWLISLSQGTLFFCCHHDFLWCIHI